MSDRDSDYPEDSADDGDFGDESSSDDLDLDGPVDDDLDFGDDPIEDEDYSDAAADVYEQLLGRMGEASPQPRLDATRRAVELLGDVHRAYPVITVTGTNGKTSTARMVESLLRAHELRTGLFTSPHLDKVNERIVIDGEPISDRALVENWQDILPFLHIVDAELADRGQAALSFFEVLTILAFACFADAPVDVAVLEVGMGGEWDSTNVADAVVAVVTPVALDHTAILGGTLAEIARTKAGILKPASILVSAVQAPEVTAELERAVELTESEEYRLDRDFSVSTALAIGGQSLALRGVAGRYEQIYLPLYGDYQATNAAVALAAVEAFFGAAGPLHEDIVTEGFASVNSPGRLELVGIDPSVLVDAAHNPAGAAALATALTGYFNFDRLVVVVGVLADKDATGIIRALATVADTFVFTESESPRAVPADELAELLQDEPDLAERFSGRVIIEPNLVSALDQARDLVTAVNDDEISSAILVTGSITLIGETRAIAAEEGWKDRG